MATARLTVRLPVAFVVLTGVLAGLAVTAATGSVPGTAGRLLDGGLPVAVGAVAAAVCLRTAAPLTGAARRWRLLLGIGLLGWTVGRLVQTLE